MAQSGYTPLLIYSSSTAAAAPTAGNLTNSTLGSELAINIADGKLFYKDSGNSVQVIAWKTTPTTAGGTGLTSYIAGDLLYYATGTTLTKLAIGANKTILTSSGTAPQWSVSLDTTQGGTGITSYTAGDLPYFATGTALSKLAIGANTYVLTSNGTAPVWTAPSSVVIGTATNLAGGAAGSVPYQTAASTTTMLSIGSAYQALQVNAGGTAPSWQASATSTLTAQGDLLYASAANTLARLAKNTTATRYLSNTGSSNNPAWAQVDLTNGVTGTLPIGNGGTNLTSYTANYVLYATATNTLGTSANFTFDGTGLNIGGQTRFGAIMLADSSNVNNAAYAYWRNNNSDGGNRLGYFSYISNTISIGTASESTGAANNTLLSMAYNQISLSTGSSATNPTERIRIASGGATYFPGVGTTASAANAFLDSGSSPTNNLLRSTSSVRYKTDIENIEPQRSDAILNFRPVWYRSLAEADKKEWSWYGLIAEEVAEIEPRLVQWGYKQSDYENVKIETEQERTIVDENGVEKVETYTIVKTEQQLKPGAKLVPDGVQYDRVAVMLLDVVKRQNKRIEMLEAKVTALENK